MRALEIFSGAGGLAKGLELAGAKHCGFVEWNPNAVRTLARNYSSALVHHTDVRDVDFTKFPNVEILAGGPPCQPFSISGKHRGNLDDRDMFPHACRAISETLPKAFMFENVKGLLRRSFAKYFEYIVLRLSYPEFDQQNATGWEEHLAQLEKIHTSGKYPGARYRVVWRLLNAADYGIPQTRERVVLVGIREDLKVEWSFPAATHSLDSLLWSQFGSGDYWDRHDIAPRPLDSYDQKIQQRTKKVLEQYQLFAPPDKPWRTVRDCLKDIPEPTDEPTRHGEHERRDGARTYPGHTGSLIDLPAKTLKAGDHGVPGGENMIRFHDGSVRYFTTYEAKLIQTFPRSYRITGSWTEAMRQVGNAVPVRLAQVLGGHLMATLGQTSI